MTNQPANPSPAPELLAKLAEVQAAGERAGGYLLEREVWFTALRAALVAEGEARERYEQMQRDYDEAAQHGQNWFAQAMAWRDQLAAATREAETLRDYIIRAHGMATGRWVQDDTEMRRRIGAMLDKAIDEDPIMRGFLGRGGPEAHRDAITGSGSLAALAPRSPEGEGR